jgi:hypothetical protein
MVEDGTVTRWQLKNSVALIAISGNDYAGMSNTSTHDQVSTHKIYRFSLHMHVSTFQDYMHYYPYPKRMQILGLALEM